MYDDYYNKDKTYSFNEYFSIVRDNHLKQVYKLYQIEQIVTAHDDINSIICLWKYCDLCEILFLISEPNKFSFFCESCNQEETRVIRNS